MEFVILLLFIFFVVYAVTPKPRQGKSNTYTDRLSTQKKQCPPHQWYWQEIIDQDRNKQGERIVCKICGPLSRQTDENVE